MTTFLVLNQDYVVASRNSLVPSDEFSTRRESNSHDHHHHHPRQDDRRPLALDRPRGAVRGHADDRARRDDRERRAALDPGRPRLQPEQPRLDRQRLHDRLRWTAAAGRAPRRPDRPAQGLPHRPRRVHGRLGRVRRRARPGRADRRALRAGRRRRADLRRDPRHDRDDVPGAPGAGQGDRRLRLRRLRRRLDRPAGRRRADRGHLLALDLLHQPADRHRDRRAGPALRRGGRGARPRRRRRPARRGAAHRRPDARRLHDPAGRRAGLGRDLDARARRRLARARGRVRRPPGARGEPADAAAPVPLAQRRRGEPRAGPRRRRHVRHVLPRRPVPAAGARLRPAPGRPGLPAQHARHGRPLDGLLGPDHDALRRQADADPVAGVHRRRHAAGSPARRSTAPTWRT